MFITIIQDCTDDNARMRQETRFASYFGITPSYCRVADDLNQWGQIEASINLIDALDASEGQEGIVVVNGAPRNGHAKRWPNGSPFGLFYSKHTLVISTVDGYTLSLVKKLKLIETIRLLDVPTVVHSVKDVVGLTPRQCERIINTQFRSYEFVPRLALWVTQGIEIPSRPYSITEVNDPLPIIWWIDNFGNCKTTLLPKDIGFKAGKKIQTTLGPLPCFNRLKDVPDGQAALVIDSCGFDNPDGNDDRFIHIAVQGTSAAKHFNLNIGDTIP